MWPAMHAPLDVAWGRIIEAMSQLHAALGAVVLGTSALLALAAFGTNMLDRSPRGLDGLRLLISGLAVAGAASGLALAINGPGPSEAIHWLYGVIIVALPVLAASVDFGGSARVRSTAFGIAGVLMALIAWRLASSG